jgi:hypothetical protein
MSELFSILPVTLTHPSGQTVMHWPQAMQPKAFALSMAIPSSHFVSTSTGQVSAQSPHFVQISLSMTGLPGASP